MTHEQSPETLEGGEGVQPRLEPAADAASDVGCRDSLETALAHLTSLADGWECGAKMEDAIVSAYQPELDAFSERNSADQPHDLRVIRAVLDARRNRDGFRKDAAALRLVLAEFGQRASTRAAQAENPEPGLNKKDNPK